MRVRQPVERQHDPAQHEAQQEQEVREGERRLGAERAGHQQPEPGERDGAQEERGEDHRHGRRRTRPEPEQPDRDADEEHELDGLDEQHGRGLRGDDDRGARRAPTEPLEDAVRPLVAGRDRERHEARGDHGQRDRAGQQAIHRRAAARATRRVERAEHEQDARRDDERDQQALAAPQDEPELVGTPAPAPSVARRTGVAGVPAPMGRVETGVVTRRVRRRRPRRRRRARGSAPRGSRRRAAAR